MNKEIDYDSHSYRMEILESYKQIGLQLFDLQDYSEIRIPCEAGTIIIGLDCDSARTLSIRQQVGDGTLTNDIGLYPSIDRNDAMRLAGILMAWAYLDDLHNPEEQQKSSLGAEVA